MRGLPLRQPRLKRYISVSMEISSTTPSSGQAAALVPPRSDNATVAAAASASTGNSSVAAPAATQASAVPSNPATDAIRAAARQYAGAHTDGLAPLLANLAAAADSGTLPDNVCDVVNQLLGMQLLTDEPPTADDIKTALQNSGLFTESNFAAQLGRDSSQPVVPSDIKSLLLILRQSLADWAGDAATVSAEDTASSSASSDTSVLLRSSAGGGDVAVALLAEDEVTIPLTPVILPSGTLSAAEDEAAARSPAPASAQNSASGQTSTSAAFATPGQLLGTAALLAAAEAEVETVPSSLLQVLSVEADAAETAFLAQNGSAPQTGVFSSAGLSAQVTMVALPEDAGTEAAGWPGSQASVPTGGGSGTQTEGRVPIHYAPTALQRAAFASEPDTGLYSALKASSAGASNASSVAVSASSADLPPSSSASLPASGSALLPQAAALKMAGQAPGLAGLMAGDPASPTDGMPRVWGGAATGSAPSASTGAAADISAAMPAAAEDDAALAAMIGALTGAAAMAGALATTSGRLAGMDALAAFLLGKGNDSATSTLIAQSAVQSGAPTAAQAGAKSATEAGKAGSSALPLRDGPVTAQGAATSSLPQNGDVGTLARHLLSDSETALAHQKLLQMASLPDSDPGQRSNSAHWMFEIPLATPQGPAVAQFAIDRDGGEKEENGGSTGPVWRVRFSVDVEPLGPVQAQLALNGENTWVTLWAERPSSLARLKAGADQLSDALADDAALKAEIAFHPVAVAKRPASGRFLDHTS